MTQTKGRFLVIDGGDGSGKGTAIESLQVKFPDPGIVRFTREPGGTPYAEDIRALILKNPHAKNADANTMFALFLAARCDHVAKLIRPSLESGIHIISDRFDASTFSFQIWAQEGYHLRSIFEEAHEAFFGDVKPDLYIYMDVDPEEGARRIADRGDRTHFDERKADFHRKSREGYLKFIEDRPHRIIDANRPKEEVVAEVIRVVEEALA